MESLNSLLLLIERRLGQLVDPLLTFGDGELVLFLGFLVGIGLTAGSLCKAWQKRGQ